MTATDRDVYRCI